jgi:hypothetical protein
MNALFDVLLHCLGASLSMVPQSEPLLMLFKVGISWETFKKAFRSTHVKPTDKLFEFSSTTGEPDLKQQLMSSKAVQVQASSRNVKSCM